MSLKANQFTLYDLVVFSFLVGLLVMGQSFGLLRVEIMVLSLSAISLVSLAYLVLRHELSSPGRFLGASRKFLHLVGGSMLVLGVIWSPLEIPFLALTLLTVYLVYETFRWWIPRRQMWLSSMLDFFGSPEEGSGRPFWEAILGMAAVCLVLYAFDTEIALISLINLTFGDGVAGLARDRLGEEARNFGLWKGWRGSVLGALASSLIVLVLTGNSKLLISVLVGMIVERFPIPIDDNFTVPMSTALSAWLLNV